MLGSNQCGANTARVVAASSFSRSTTIPNGTQHGLLSGRNQKSTSVSSLRWMCAAPWLPRKALSSGETSLFHMSLKERVPVASLEGEGESSP